MRIEYHRTLIADRVRNQAFRDALAQVIRKGETTVADIGAGTGLIGLIAARLGAKRVTLYEVAEVGAVAEAHVKASGLRNVTVVPGHSTAIVDPPRADVVVSETLGNYAFEEHIIETLDDARQRYLKPGGLILPSAVRQVLAPVMSPRLYEDMTEWRRVGPALGLTLDLSTAETMSLNNIYVRRLQAADLLDEGSTAQQWDAVDLTAKGNSANRKGTARWPVAAPATFHGLALWWEADLVPGIVLSTSPLAPPTHWDQLYLPVLAPIGLAAGETLEVRIKASTSLDAGTDIAWSLVVKTPAGKQRLRQDLDLAKGYLP